MRVCVVEVGNKAKVNLVVLRVVHKCAAGRVALCERPTQPMYDFTFFVFGRIDLPNLFDANRIMLRVFTLVEVELTEKLLAQMPPTTLCK